jgi:peptide/nickel transport system permease protein
MIEPVSWKQSEFVRFIKRLAGRKIAVFGSIIVLVLILVAIFAPLIAPQSPLDQDVMNRLAAPSKSHPFGLDSLGRDVFSRTIYGSRVSLMVGVISIGIAAGVGIILGLISGYFARWVDSVIMRIMDAIMAIPGLLLTIAIAAALGPGLRNVMIAVGIVYVPTFARLVRGQVLSVRQQDYVKAARTVGASDARLILKHIWPNSLQPVIVQATLSIGFAILIEAGASFLGVGAQPPTPTWGSMLRASYSYIGDAPWLSVAPGLAIMLSVLGFNLLGDGLRDALDPRLRGVI